MQLALWQSIPFACILLPLGSAAMTSVLRGRAARYWTTFVLCAEVVLDVAAVVVLLRLFRKLERQSGEVKAL